MSDLHLSIAAGGTSDIDPLCRDRTGVPASCTTSTISSSSLSHSSVHSPFFFILLQVRPPLPTRTRAQAVISFVCAFLYPELRLI